MFIGLGKGGISIIYPVLLRALFGMKHIGLLLGIIGVGSGIGTIFSALLIFDYKNLHSIPVSIWTFLGLTALAIAWFIPDRRDETLPKGSGGLRVGRLA